MEKVKLTKELLDKVRHIEGFPIGRDEDIIALSDPPFYTAFPNPFIEDFIKKHGKPYDEVNDDYHREPFAADVTEGKNDPIYNAHTYHTKVPHKAIMRYILHYTEPGDIVFDGFCGTGMTGVAAQMCENPDKSFKKKIEHEMVKVKWGGRKAILCDLSPAATFIAYNYNNSLNIKEFEKEAKHILYEVEKECGWMYETQHVLNNQIQNDSNNKPIVGKINYVIWSDVYICPNCSKEIVFWDAAVDKEASTVHREFSCLNCNTMLSKYNMEKAWNTKFDKDVNKTIRFAKQVPVLINYTANNKRFYKKPDDKDYSIINTIENMDKSIWYPTDSVPEGYNTEQPKKSHGTINAHHFYTKRNLLVLATLFDLSLKSNYPKQFLFLMTSFIIKTGSKLHNIGFKDGNINLAGAVPNTLYIPSINAERNVFLLALGKLKDLLCVFGFSKNTNNFLITCNSTTNLYMPDNSVDYIFTDPPFGFNLMYSELNFLWDTWLRVFTNNKNEAIINKIQQKGINEYRLLMEHSFKEKYRVLKPCRWMTMVFHNSKNAVWNAIQESLLRAGFIIADVRILNKKQGTFKQMTTTTAMKEDLVVTIYKPKPSFLKQFAIKAGSEDGVWEFIKQHLEQLPVAVSRDNIVEVLAERQNYMLYDRMVAFHLENGYTIPLGASDFYQGLHQRFPERDSMYFLPHQIPQYEQKRAKAIGVGQLSLFVQDERTAIQWVRSKLEDKRQTVSELTSQFLKEVNYVRWEKQLELSEILDQNFLNDDEGRWYVPDPNKQADLERLREKALLKDFEQYRESKGKLKVFRTEAIRAGFKGCWKNKDFQSIVSIGQRIPEAVIQDDSSLLMYYNNALTRIEN